MNRRFLFSIVSVMMLASCQRDLPWVVAPDIMAESESEGETRTSISVDGSGKGTIYWNPADKIDVFFGTKRVQYTSQNSSDATTASFKSSDSVSETDLSSTNIWGLYPSDPFSSCDGSRVTTTLPSKQFGVANTFDEDLFPAVAHSSTTSLQFYNVCGGIKFTLAYDNIKKITLRGNNDEDLAGKVSISFVSGVPQATIVSGTKEITLTPKTGTTFQKGADYYFILLPGILWSGFEMTFTATDGTTGILNYTEKTVTIKRSVFGRKGYLDAYADFSDGRQANNVIYYTSSDEKVVTPYKTDRFGRASIVSNDYVAGRGIIAFDGVVTSIGEDAFSFNCDKLATIDIPNSVTSIGKNAFSSCGLTSIGIPKSVTSIGDLAFFSCGLTSIDIPKSVTRLGANPFGGCWDLKTVVVQSGNPVYDSRNNCNAIVHTSSNELVTGCRNTRIPNSVTRIGDYAFYSVFSNTHYGSMSSFKIPDTVTHIGDYAFYECWFFQQSLELPSSLTFIGDYAFFDSAVIPVFPSSLKSIGDYAFYATYLTSIEIPSSVTHIGTCAFGYCPEVSAIVVQAGNPVYDSRNDCNAIVHTASNELITGCRSTLIPDSVTSIGNFAFVGSGLDSIEIPGSVKHIGDRAFNSCHMTSITVSAVSPPSLGTLPFYDTGDCPIYVPAESVNAYKSAWSTYANRIRAMQ